MSRRRFYKLDTVACLPLPPPPIPCIMMVASANGDHVTQPLDGAYSCEDTALGYAFQLSEETPRGTYTPAEAMTVQLQIWHQSEFAALSWNSSILKQSTSGSVNSSPCPS